MLNLGLPFFYECCHIHKIHGKPVGSSQEYLILKLSFPLACIFNGVVLLYQLIYFCKNSALYSLFLCSPSCILIPMK